MGEEHQGGGQDEDSEDNSGDGVAWNRNKDVQFVGMKLAAEHWLLLASSSTSVLLSKNRYMAWFSYVRASSNELGLKESNKSVASDSWFYSYWISFHNFFTIVYFYSLYGIGFACISSSHLADEERKWKSVASDSWFYSYLECESERAEMGREGLRGPCEWQNASCWYCFYWLAIGAPERHKRVIFHHWCIVSRCVCNIFIISVIILFIVGNDVEQEAKRLRTVCKH